MTNSILRKAFFVVATLALAGPLASALAQTPTAGIKPSALTGDVVSVTGDKIILQTKDGAVDIVLSAATEYKRVPPENPTLKAAVASNISEIAVGDKLLVTGILSEDKKTLPARAVYLMTKSDIAEKKAKDSERWAKGIAGKVTAVNPQTGQISVEVRGLMNTSTVVITPKPGAAFRRYAPNSVKYSEARASSVNEIQAGDMLRATGERSADGASFSADEVVTGAFRTVAGTVKTVDTAKNEIVIADMQSKKDVTVELGSVSVMKRFPEEWAQRMAQFQGGQGGMRPAGGPPADGQRPAGAGAPGAGAPGRGFGGGPRGGIDEMLERFPNITAADLKPGDVIAVSTSKDHAADRLSAIKLLAGVEPFLRAAQAQAAAAGQRGQAGSPSLNIPGLEGFDIP